MTLPRLCAIHCAERAGNGNTWRIIAPLTVVMAVILIVKLQIGKCIKSISYEAARAAGPRPGSIGDVSFAFSSKTLPEVGSEDPRLALSATLALLNAAFGPRKFTEIEDTVYRNRDRSVVVFKARHKMHGVVAVKMMSVGDADTQRRCAREDYLLETFSAKRHICRRFDSKMIERPGFNPVQVLVLEYMEMGTVADMLERAPAGRLDQSTAARIGIAVLSGLQAFHERGIVHRDIKDSNIGVTVKDGVMAFKIIDLGISVADEADAGGAGPVLVHDDDVWSILGNSFAFSVALNSQKFCFGHVCTCCASLRPQIQSTSRRPEVWTASLAVPGT